jgi:hypothetical protein
MIDSTDTSQPDSDRTSWILTFLYPLEVKVNLLLLTERERGELSQEDATPAEISYPFISSEWKLVSP